MSATEKIYDLLSDIECPDVFLNNNQKFRIAEYLAKKDVMPVVHGRWIEREDFNPDTYFDCSVCGDSFCFIEGEPDMSLYLYCPNCGAKMDGDRDD